MSFSSTELPRLSAERGGRLLLPGDADYDRCRRVWNGAIDRRPALIAQCGSADDVAAVVRFAGQRRLPLALRGGGHSFAGHSTCDGGVVLDLAQLKVAYVDRAAQRARVQPGLTWGEFDAATAAAGLATTGGMISTTGITGLTLGGGVGWLMRRRGLSCDNLLGATLVTADGGTVHAGESGDADLLWALRGGGGNFGVVIELEYALHPVHEVLLGLAMYPMTAARQALGSWAAFASAAPHEVGSIAFFVTAPPAPFVPADVQGQRVLLVALAWSEAAPAPAAVAAELRRFGPPAAELVTTLPYPALQGMFDGSAPYGVPRYAKAESLSSMSGGALDAVVARAASIGSPLTELHIHLLGGAVAEVDEGATAFPGRQAACAVHFLTGWQSPEEAAGEIAWARASAAALRPWSVGGYLNFPSDGEAEMVSQAFGSEKLARLRAVKQRYDPGNLFRLNANFTPAG